jgi:hypothetical protein
VLEVPNMSGWLNLRLLNLARMQELVGKHNLNTMKQEFFKSIADKFDLEIEFLGYIGGFDPGMVVHNHDSRKHGRTPIMYPLYAMERLISRLPFAKHILSKLNGQPLSNMLVGIFRVPDKGLSD